MKIQSIIVSTLAMSMGCDTVKPSISGGDCPDPIPVSYEGDLRADVVQSFLDPDAGDASLDLNCDELCAESIRAAGEQHYPNNILSCEYSLDFDTLPADFFEWSAEDRAGEIVCSGEEVTYCMGRRPLGHVESGMKLVDLGSHFACAAHLEAASVTAFNQLGAQLQGWGAPESLVRRCRQAAADERVHTRIFARLAKDCGVGPEDPQLESAPADLLSAAIHNATEGCVNESWAALIAAHQSLHVSDPVLRKIYRRVAIDESRHGQLAWDIHRWMLSQLDEEGRGLVRSAQEKAFDRLLVIAGNEGKERFLGRPTAVEAEEMVRSFVGQLKAAA